MADKPISDGDLVVKRDDPLRQVIRALRVDDGLTGVYLLPDGHSTDVRNEPIELYRHATPAEISSADERSRLPPA